jgi:hypothetical protein
LGSNRPKRRHGDGEGALDHPSTLVLRGDDRRLRRLLRLPRVRAGIQPDRDDEKKGHHRPDPHRRSRRPCALTLDPHDDRIVVHGVTRREPGERENGILPSPAVRATSFR